jgi:hypothetical protein
MANLKWITVLAAIYLSTGCDKDTESKTDGHGGEHSEGGSSASGTEDKCCILGALCHVVGDDVDPEIVACHELGHENNPASCAERFESCQAICEGATDSHDEHACE